MIERTYDVELISAATATKRDLSFDVEGWVDEERNIALIDDTRSVGLFEYEYPGLYTGHYFFQPETRGKAARALAQKMLRSIFIDYGAKAIRGLTPIENRAACWLTRQIGFESMGPVETQLGTCELFVLTPDRFYHTLNKD